MRQVLKRQTLIKYINIYQILKHSSETPLFLRYYLHRIFNSFLRIPTRQLKYNWKFFLK